MAKPIILKFDANQQFQLDAISAVVDLFQGFGFYAQTANQFALTGAGAIGGSEEILPNLPHGEELYDSDILPNLHEIQERHGLELEFGLKRNGGPVLEGAGTELHEFPSFTIEMETGTGKTYCYFRTIYELRQKYGFSKFIIIVPSIAIFQGVLKTEEITRTHFRSLYGNEQVDVYGYDGSRLNRVRVFATANTTQVMVMTVDSFNKLNNNIYKASEKLPGELKPYQYIQQARPIVILDEPQSLDNTEKARQAIRTLHPLFGLRYSATHRTHPNLVYRLSPVEAYRQNLVKRITVVGVSQTENVNAPQMTLEKVTQDPLRAHVRTRVMEQGETKEKVIPLKQNDHLVKKTKREEHVGFVVANISAVAGDKFIEFENGVKLTLEGQGTGQGQTAKPEVFRVQIEETIKAHFAAQDQLKERGIKVLSLFFIDRVANYRGDGALIRRLFEEGFERLKPSSQHFAQLNAVQVHNGYFAQRKVKGAKDANAVEEFDTNLDETKKNKEEKEAERAAFKLIMQDKERLLSFDEPVSFLFAHSALREGWDNPNVFQICTLNQSASPMKKRQEIGRGLRLCVNQDGARATDEDVNILTVVANESYKSFCEKLQEEYKEEGDEAPPKPTNKKTEDARRNDDIYHSDEFKDFWRKLNRRARYHIKLDQTTLIEECADALNQADFHAPTVARTKGRFVITEFKIELKRVKGETAVLRVEVKDTDGKTTVKDELPLKKRDKLAVVMHDPRFRNYTIAEITGAGDDASVRFANGIEVTPFQPYEFDSEQGQHSEETEIIELDYRYPVFDFIGRAAEQTHLTRQTLNQIFARFAERAGVTIFRNPEGFTRLFIETIKRIVALHVAERVEFEIATDEAFDTEDLFPETKPFPQQEVVESGQRGLYDKTQVDSDVERFFVESRLRLDEDATMLFFKFPPKFKLDFPRIIGNYNPDWGVVRIEHGKVKLQLVRETKGTTELDKLQYSQEKLKIRCAQRYFEALGVDYRVVDQRVDKWWLADGVAEETLLS